MTYYRQLWSEESRGYNVGKEGSFVDGIIFVMEKRQNGHEKFEFEFYRKFKKIQIKKLNKLKSSFNSNFIAFFYKLCKFRDNFRKFLSNGQPYSRNFVNFFKTFNKTKSS